MKLPLMTLFWNLILLLKAFDIGFAFQQQDSRMRSNEGFLKDEENKKTAGFLPMRGKKADAEDKRMSFMPMRGKKMMVADGLFDNEEPVYIAEAKRAGFMPMRGRRGYQIFPDNRQVGPLNSFNSPPFPLIDYSHYVPGDKKASGFMPMRGKKELDEDGLSPLDDGLIHQEEKKAGFHALRGRRNMEESGRNWMEKKRGSGFIGMRGRR